MLFNITLTFREDKYELLRELNVVMRGLVSRANSP